ncbi:WhiB family transcriptional regulator [Ferrimicrobium sp.]|uniref:WhiB family transcriptional regulator n=1 Tax=Ferrimicrobium TaxID=121038 RepID=UPI00345B7480
MSDLRWRTHAACLNADLPPQAWFPYEELTIDNYKAILICERCPVASECFEEGIELRDWHTIRAGIPGPARHRITRLKA